MNTFLENLKDSPKARRNGLIIVVVVLLALVVVIMDATSERATTGKAGAGKPSRTLLTGENSESLALTALKNQIDEMTRALGEERRAQEKQEAELQKQLEALQRDLNAVKTQAGTAREQTRRAMAEIEKRVQKGLTSGDIRLPPGSVQEQTNDGATGSDSPGRFEASGSTSLPTPVVRRRGVGEEGGTTMKIRSITHASGDASKLTAAAKKSGTANEEVAEEPIAESYLPSGTIFSGTLITGLDAPTGVMARRDPFPALMRVKADAILPNRFRADVRECFLLASGYGELSTERVMLRAERLSCVTEDRKVIETSIDAYVVGSDSKAGIRGRLVHRAGALLGKSLLAGFFSGVAEATKPQSILGIDTSPGANALFQDREMEDVARAGVYSGTSNAMERIADYYLSAAEQIFPIIELDGGRRVDFVLTSGFKMKAI